MEATRAAPIGKVYGGGIWQVERGQFQAYASATDDRNRAYGGADAVAPPMYHVRPFIDLMLSMAKDPELGIDILRLVHGEHAMAFHRPLRHGDALELAGELLSVDVKSSGTVYGFALRGSVDGELALEGTTAYFVRAAKPADRGDRGPRPEPAATPEPSWSMSQPVSADQAARYALASGDDNPIHTDEDVAKRAGLPRTILHGLCTLALAARDIVDRCADGDPTRLASLSVRWARPVFPGDTLTLQAWTAGGAVDFQTLGPDGKPVLVSGRAVLRAAE